MLVYDVHTFYYFSIYWSDTSLVWYQKKVVNMNDQEIAESRITATHCISHQKKFRGFVSLFMFVCVYHDMVRTQTRTRTKSP